MLAEQVRVLFHIVGNTLYPYWPYRKRDNNGAYLQEKGAKVLPLILYQIINLLSSLKLEHITEACGLNVLLYHCILKARKKVRK